MKVFLHTNLALTNTVSEDRQVSLKNMFIYAFVTKGSVNIFSQNISTCIIHIFACYAAVVRKEQDRWIGKHKHAHTPKVRATVSLLLYQLYSVQEAVICEQAPVGAIIHVGRESVQPINDWKLMGA